MCVYVTQTAYIFLPVCVRVSVSVCVYVTQTAYIFLPVCVRVSVSVCVSAGRQGLSPPFPQPLSELGHHLAVGRHVGHVVVALGVLGVVVQLRGVHVRPVGGEGAGLVGHPLRVALRLRAHRVAHDADTLQRWADGVSGWHEGRSRVLTEHRFLPLHRASLRFGRVYGCRPADVAKERGEAVPLRAEGHAERVRGTRGGHIQARQIRQRRVDVHSFHQRFGGQGIRSWPRVVARLLRFR